MAARTSRCRRSVRISSSSPGVSGGAQHDQGATCRQGEEGIRGRKEGSREAGGEQGEVRPIRQYVTIALGLVIGSGYIYKIIVDGLPDFDTSAPERWGFCVGTTLGLLAAALLVCSGLLRASAGGYA